MKISRKMKRAATGCLAAALLCTGIMYLPLIWAVF